MLLIHFLSFELINQLITSAQWSTGEFRVPGEIMSGSLLGEDYENTFLRKGPSEG